MTRVQINVLSDIVMTLLCIEKVHMEDWFQSKVLRFELVRLSS